MDYVLVWCKRNNASDDTLLILKSRPEWQKGVLNLPGGKIEKGETPEKAAARELFEETGYEAACTPRVMGIMQGVRNTTVYCLKTVVIDDALPNANDKEADKPMWLKWHQVLGDKRLMPNLRVIIPLLVCGVSDWIIGDNYEGETKSRHIIAVNIPTLQSSDGQST